LLAAATDVMTMEEWNDPYHLSTRGKIAGNIKTYRCAEYYLFVFAL
jgi:hypothetical protein